MPKILLARRTRRDILCQSPGIAVALIGTVASPAIVRAQSVRNIATPLVAGLNAKIGDPTYESIAQISRILKTKFNIGLDIQVHPSSTLGTDVQQLEAVQTGYIDITSNVTAQFSSFSDAFAFVDLPYAIPSWDFFRRLTTSELWRQQVAKFEAKLPLKVLPPVGAGGFRILWNNKRPLPTPATVKGLKVRTTDSPLEIALIRAWGGNPTPLAWTETYNALASGVVDGMNVQPIWTYSFRMYEVLKYGTETDAIFAVQLQVMNKKTWQSLGTDVQTAFEQAAQEAADQANTLSEASEKTYKEKLREVHMEIYKPSVQQFMLWKRPGEGIWSTASAQVDRNVMKSLLALQ